MNTIEVETSLSVSVAIKMEKSDEFWELVNQNDNELGIYVEHGIIDKVSPLTTLDISCDSISDLIFFFYLLGRKDILYHYE